MKHLSLIVLMFSLTACNKLHGPLSGIQGNAPYSAKTFMVMGQSNAVRWGDNGGPDAFTRDVQGFAPGPITWIKCATGGTSIDQWQKRSATGLYNTCVAMAQGKHIDAIIWDQGEVEAEQPDQLTAELWAMKFTDMMTSFRVDIGNPQTVILYARLGPAKGLPMTETVRASQESVHIPYGHIVDLDAFPVPMGLHYDASVYPALSQAYADAYRQFLNGE